MLKEIQTDNRVTRFENTFNAFHMLFKSHVIFRDVSRPLPGFLQTGFWLLKTCVVWQYHGLFCLEIANWNQI